MRVWFLLAAVPDRVYSLGFLVSRITNTCPTSYDTLIWNVFHLDGKQSELNESSLFSRGFDTAQTSSCSECFLSVMLPTQPHGSDS